PGAPNSGILVHDIVINEIMYAPISGEAADQYLELYNKGTLPVDLSGWKFTTGINFTFPANTKLAPDSYLVVANNAARLMSNYPNLNPANTVGNFGGKLSKGGKRIALAMPDEIVSTNKSGVVVTNTIHIVVDEVTYGTGGRWGTWSHE